MTNQVIKTVEPCFWCGRMIAWVSATDWEQIPIEVQQDKQGRWIHHLFSKTHRCEGSK